MDQIDWNVELRKIEREYDGLPPEPSQRETRAQKLANLRAREQVEERITLFGAIARLLLVGLLIGALWWWPYATKCGLGLGGFLGAQAMVVIGAAWAAVFSWRHRLAASHTIALVLLLTGLALVAVQVLPRFGLVTVTGMHATQWRCAAISGSAAVRQVTPERLRA
jgi:hypothetical protein